MASRISKKTRLIIMVTLIVVAAVIVGVVLSNGSCSPSDSTPQSDEAPDFTLPTMTGAEITLSELEGTPVVLNFWSIPCFWCRYQLPFLEAVAIQSEEEMKVIAVNIVDTAASLQNFFGDYEPTMIIALDKNREAFADYCLAYNNTRGDIPFTFFINSEGIVKYWQRGAFGSEAQLWDTLASVFNATVP